MKKALMFASVASMIEQFNMQNIRILISLGYQVEVACNFDYGSSTTQAKVKNLKKNLKDMNVKMYNIQIPRNITSIKNLKKSYDSTKKIIDQNKYEIIHCHSPIGGVIARLAAKNQRSKGTSVVYTAHGFHFYKGAPLLNWLLYYPVEKLLSRFTDILLTINKEDYYRAKRKFHSRSIKYIPGVGVNTQAYLNSDVDKKVKFKELNIPGDPFIVLSVGELNENKNHKTIIKAISQIENDNVYYIICGIGSLRDNLLNLSKKLGIQDRVILLGYREDIKDIYHISDIFAFPSRREGLGLAALEAMASSLPIVTSNVHGITDYSVNTVTGLTCDPNNTQQFKEALIKLITDENLRNKIQENNNKIVKKYDIQVVNEKMYSIYKDLKYDSI